MSKGDHFHSCFYNQFTACVLAQGESEMVLSAIKYRRK